VWAYEWKKPGLPSTSSFETIPMRDTWLSSFKLWQMFGYDTCSGRGHVAVVATISAVWRDGGPPRDPGQAKVIGSHGRFRGRGRWYAMADRRGPVGR